jgi:hypothetical protein
VGDADAALLQRGLEGEAAADDKGDQVIPPVLRDVRWLVHLHAVFVDGVLRHVSPDVTAGEQRTARLAGVEHPQDGARLGVPLREQQHVEGLRLRNDHQVGLRVACTPP